MSHQAFDSYFNSMFRQANTFSDKEYDSMGLSFKINHGRYLPKNRDAAILDLGCGAGHFLHFLRSEGYTNVSGVDVSPQQVDFCREKGFKNVTHADGREYLNSHPETFDAVIANDIVEHLPKSDVIEFLKSAYSSLKPSGLLVLKTPNMGNPAALYSRYFDFTHETGYTEKSIYQILFLAGFTEISVHPVVPSARTLRRMIERFIQKVLLTMIRKSIQYQGAVAPSILTINLLALAVKSSDPSAAE